ncbi:ATP-binding protein [Thermococcus indicus]|uniref:ATP-binding protein n=1 Tax=Thermococcus indicus TaxID=2586643 RepID=A0A4Y5SLC8_9EURY|nr:ATP-binding protein [Thermococcus indicus]QDA31595.1 ATP-binding protein [Thermococcus indicus]
MQSLYLSLFEKCRKGYEAELARGKVDEARKYALNCAEILKALAEKAPDRREFYLEKAKRWEEVAEELKIPSSRKERASPREGAPADEYRAQVEGLITSSTVTWRDIGGLDDVKRLLAKNVAIAFAKRPEAIKPWKGILLFGPPGTGKTLLASAAAGSLKATFFNVKASDVLSKYYGESSKLITALYGLAREKAPSIVFIDEVDALSLRRENVHEATRRALATLLSEIDGFKGGGEKFVLTLASTNTPWDLDEALLSRFPLRIYVPLPDKEAVKEIVRIHTRGLDTSTLDLEAIAEESVKRLYSGREIANLCNLAIHHMLEEENPELADLERLSSIEVEGLKLKVRPLEMEDFEEAFKRIKSPLTRKEIERYEKWARQFGGSLYER